MPKRMPLTAMGKILRLLEREREDALAIIHRSHPKDSKLREATHRYIGRCESAIELLTGLQQEGTRP